MKQTHRNTRNTLPVNGRQLYCHCGRPAVLRSAEGLCRTHWDGAMAYVCSGYPACNSYVMAQPGTLEPRGSLAGPELRRLRAQAHKQLERIQRAGLMSKRQTYQWIAYVVQAPMAHAHIGHLGEYDCKEIIRKSDELLASKHIRNPEALTHKGGGQSAGAYAATAKAR